MNPAGQVPVVLLADGRPLAESNAILLHLAEKSALVPADGYARAKMLEWMFWEQYSHEPYVAVARFQVRYLGRSVAELEPRIVERGIAALQRLEQALAQTRFLVGDDLSLADIALVAYTRVAGEGGFELAPLSKVRAWIGRVEIALGILPPVAMGREIWERMLRRLASALLCLCVVLPSQALAWGASGHRMVGEVAIGALPAELPAFVRTRTAALAVAELSREPDRAKGAGEIHDTDRDPAHFVDVSDDGTVLGGPRLDALPKTRADYERALRAAGTDSWQAGYLPYAIVDRWQQLVKDFAYWRVLSAAERNPAWATNRAWFAADRARREAQILEHAGELSHFVGDGAQPLHVTVHFNGWGELPNPAGYTSEKIHGPFEGALVRARVRPEAVAVRLAPFRSCGCSIAQRTADYLEATSRLVVPFYELEKAGGLRPGDARGPAFARDQLTRSAAELRDLIVEAWRASATEEVGWKPVQPADVAAGRVDPFPSLYGTD